jgi:CDP-paratose 2-epimerase
MFGLRAVINRCGVVSGPWQMGHSEQGVFAHWMFAHAFRRPLSYLGYGGLGQQVRDVMHVADLADLIEMELAARDQLHGEVFNAGGGVANSVSLAEFTDHCAALTGTRLAIQSVEGTRPGDVPIYITDNAKVHARFGWVPRRSVGTIAADLFAWIREHGDTVRATLS